MDQLKSTGQASRRGFRRRKLNDDAGYLINCYLQSIEKQEFIYFLFEDSNEVRREKHNIRFEIRFCV